MAKQATAKRGRGRPPTNVVWREIGVRFTAAEKPALKAVAKKRGVSQAAFIRAATLEAAGITARP